MPFVSWINQIYNDFNNLGLMDKYESWGDFILILFMSKKLTVNFYFA